MFHEPEETKKMRHHLIIVYRIEAISTSLHVLKIKTQSEQSKDDKELNGINLTR